MFDHFRNGPHSNCCQGQFDLEGPPNSISEFFNFPSVWFSLYLDVGFNCIAGFKFGGGSILVPLFYMHVPLLFDKNIEDWRLQTESYSRHAKDKHTDQICPGSGLWGFRGVIHLTWKGITDQQKWHFWEYICHWLGRYYWTNKRFYHYIERLHECLCLGLQWPALCWESGDIFQHSLLCGSHFQEANRWSPGMHTYLWRTSWTNSQGRQW